MPSISHRTSLGQATPHRAESGSTALPTGFVGGVTRRIVGWLGQWRDGWRALRQVRALGDHLLRDVGLHGARDWIIAPTHRDRDAQDPKGLPTWLTIF